ncbi:MAG: glucosidase [Armatimonadetes bacterium]|nr:glucosidase [Armatimonadota bacterium]
MSTPEHQRLQDQKEGIGHWYRWGTFLSDRHWGTVREDYSADGNAWQYFPHDQARSRAYRWGEDGIAGWCDRHCEVILAWAFWNGHDPILKERYFGLTNPEGNHGEDVKELYYHLDGTPTSSYMRMVYIYPQAAYPYEDLVKTNAKIGVHAGEYELADTGVLKDDRYFEIEVTYAKVDEFSTIARTRVTNKGPEKAKIWVLPHLWFRNKWSWRDGAERPSIVLEGDKTLIANSDRYGKVQLEIPEASEFLFTENETNTALIFGGPNKSPYVKDAFHRYLIHGEKEAVNPKQVGTKACGVIELELGPGESKDLYAYMACEGCALPDGEWSSIVEKRANEADEFYQSLALKEKQKSLILRRAIAGLLWSRQYYYFDWDRWAAGDDNQPAPPPGHATRNFGWKHLHAKDIILMPDGWEYPWFAAWDLAFHCVTASLVDPDFAKDQLLLLMREWYMHPNGQIPAYEWAFSDVNPPVHAWAALKIFRDLRERTGESDYEFLERAFHKLLLNFTWWINRKDQLDNNLFEGGFLGLDNIGLFDRNTQLPNGEILEQSDGTSWMGMYCLNMLSIALELCQHDDSYADVASKFFEHFLYIANALNSSGMWDDEDGFYYDILRYPSSTELIKVRSIVGIIPLFAIAAIPAEQIATLEGFKERVQWFVRHRPDLADAFHQTLDAGSKRLSYLSLVPKERVVRILSKVFNEDEFLSPHGVRGLSKYYRNRPYEKDIEGIQHRIDYEPGESRTGVFGGNSNWRGPVWMPINYLLVEALRQHHISWGDDFRIALDEAADGTRVGELADLLSRRLISLYEPTRKGVRPAQPDEFSKANLDYLLFYEYFDGDTGRGCGANHQTGWTALIANLIAEQH